MKSKIREDEQKQIDEIKKFILENDKEFDKFSKQVFDKFGSGGFVLMRKATNELKQEFKNNLGLSNQSSSLHQAFLVHKGELGK